jgi:hypothetical protein
VRIAGLTEVLTPGLIEGDARPRTEIVAWQGEPAPPLWDTEEEHVSARDGVEVLRSRRTVRLLQGDRAAFWARDADALTRWETAAPLRTLLRWALRRHGLHVVHAAAVAGARGAALLAGASGAGKSTTALAAAEAGLGFIADDYCAVTTDAPPRVHALCAVGKLEAPWPSLRLLPGGPTPDGKHLVVPDGLTRDAPLVSILLPRVGRGGPLEPASPAEALRALATSMLLLPRSTQEDLAVLGALVRALPAYRLPLGDDPVRTIAEHLG